MAIDAPTSYDGICNWAERRGLPLKIARRRFIQFCVIDTVGSDARLNKTLILRGGAALCLFRGGRRECRDIDFVALNLDGSPLWDDSPDTPKARLNVLLNQRLPRYFKGEACWDEWLRSINVDLSPARWMYDCTSEPLLESSTAAAFGNRVLVVTPESIVADKLVAVLFQSREMSKRARDLYDIADILTSGKHELDRERIGAMARSKAKTEHKELGSKWVVGQAELTDEYERVLIIPGGGTIELQRAWVIAVQLLQDIGTNTHSTK